MLTNREKEVWEDPQYGFDKELIENIPEFFSDDNHEEYQGLGCMLYFGIAAGIALLLKYGVESNWIVSICFGVFSSLLILVVIRYLKAKTVTSIVLLPFTCYLLYLYMYPDWIDSSYLALFLSLIAAICIVKWWQFGAYISVPWLTVKYILHLYPDTSIWWLITLPIISILVVALILVLVNYIFFKPVEKYDPLK